MRDYLTSIKTENHAPRSSFTRATRQCNRYVKLRNQFVKRWRAVITSSSPSFSHTAATPASRVLAQQSPNLLPSRVSEVSCARKFSVRALVRSIKNWRVETSDRVRYYTRSFFCYSTHQRLHTALLLLPKFNSWSHRDLLLLLAAQLIPVLKIEVKCRFISKSDCADHNQQWTAPRYKICWKINT